MDPAGRPPASPDDPGKSAEMKVLLLRLALLASARLMVASAVEPPGPTRPKSSLPAIAGGLAHDEQPIEKQEPHG
jgi:hypothetical protein